MVLPFNPNGPNLGIAAAPPESVMKQRPYLQAAILGCVVAVVGKFIGKQQSTALSDLFPVVLGFVILYSQSNFYTCIAVFSFVATTAFIFSSYYLAGEFCADISGGTNFFAKSCPTSFKIDLNLTPSIQVCPYDDNSFGNCKSPVTCNSTSSGLHLAQAGLPEQELFIWEDLCDGYTITGHSALLLSVLCNGAAMLLGWSMFKASQEASAGLLADLQNRGTGQTALGDVRAGTSDFEAFRGEGQTLGST